MRVRVKIRFLLMFVLLFLTGSAVSIFVGHKVRMAEENLKNVKQAVEMEQSKVQALEAEWSYLNRPERLEKLAVDLLGMSMPETDQEFEASTLQNKSEVYVEHLFYNADFGSALPQKRFPDVVIQKPVSSRGR